MTDKFKFLWSGIQNYIKEGKSAINLSNLGNFGQIWPGHLFMLGRLAVPKIAYVRPVGSPENTSSIGENPNINNQTWPPIDPHPNSPRGFFVQKLFMAHFRLWYIAEQMQI